MAKLDGLTAGASLTGQEPFHRSGHPSGLQVMNFWRWADSELLENTLRGRLAEYLVALDLEVADGFRTEWSLFDLKTSQGITSEVKSSASFQVWHQRAPSPISLGIAPTRRWDRELGRYVGERKRQAQVYVFAVLGSRDQTEIDPTDLDQWQFHVLSTKTLNRRLRAQKTLSLSSLLKLEPATVSYGGINEALERVLGRA